MMLLFPPKCVGCGELMSPKEGAREIFCPFCKTKWEMARLPEAEKIISREDSLGGRVSLVAYRSGKTDGVPERLIYHLKHCDEARVFRYVAKELLPLVEQLSDSPDEGDRAILLTYPPRRRSAVRKDGFDQARRITQALSKLSGWPMAVLLERTSRGRKEQKKLDAKERIGNAAQAYRLSSDVKIPQGATVILIDDLYTTGATLLAAADILMKAGASRVLLATVARTVLSSPATEAQKDLT